MSPLWRTSHVLISARTSCWTVVSFKHTSRWKSSIFFSRSIECTSCTVSARLRVYSNGRSFACIYLNGLKLRLFAAHFNRIGRRLHNLLRCSRRIRPHPRAPFFRRISSLSLFRSGPLHRVFSLPANPHRALSFSLSGHIFRLRKRSRFFAPGQI